MELGAPDRKLGKIAAAFGLLQGAAWLAMSVICIVIYFENEPPTMYPTSYMEAWNNMVRGTYLYRDAMHFESQIIVPEAFLIFMFIYAVLSSAWLVTSLIQFFAVNKNSARTKLILKIWAAITMLVAGVDLALTILLGIDFNMCSTSYYGPEMELSIEQDCTDTIVPVLVIAARGFTLWFANCILACLVLQSSRSVGTGKGVVHTDPYYGGNQENQQSSIPRAAIQQPHNWGNAGYTGAPPATPSAPYQNIPHTHWANSGSGANYNNYQQNPPYQGRF